jgi:hypothetical protein
MNRAVRTEFSEGMTPGSFKRAWNIGLNSAGTVNSMLPRKLSSKPFRCFRKAACRKVAINSMALWRSRLCVVLERGSKASTNKSKTLTSDANSASIPARSSASMADANTNSER